jgi:hypothetical protein
MKMLSLKYNPCFSVTKPKQYRIRPNLRNVRVPPPRFSTNDLVRTLEYDIYVIGKSVILFTMFYCSMNWYYYRKMREEIEKEDDDEPTKN